MDEIKVNFLHFCDYAFFSQDNKLGIVGIFGRINTNNKLPALLPRFSVAINISGYSNDRKVNLKILSPNKKSILLNVDLGNGSGSADKKSTSFIVNVSGAIFNELGKYYISVSDGEKLVDYNNQEYFIEVV